MKIQTRAAVLVLVIACGESLMAFGQEATESAVASKIVALENAWSRASKAKDLKVLDQILDDDFISVDADGRLMIKAEILREAQQSGVRQVVISSTAAHVHGNTVIVTGLYEKKGVVQAKPFIRRGRFVDTWLQRGGRWVAIASLSTPIE
jgi:ketosteroid isomerase-like protein